MDVANEEAIPLPKHIEPIKPAVIPNRSMSLVLPIVERHDRRRRSHLKVFFEPYTGLLQRLDANFAGLSQLGERGNLIGESPLHRLPAEGVFLAGLGVAEGQRRILN